MARPRCVVRVEELPAEKRPKFLKTEGVESEVRAIGNASGLARMGVWVRMVFPGRAGTHRHFHLVEEEWVRVLSGSGMLRIGPHRLPVRAGHFVGFPPGPRPHHFLATGSQPLVLLEGGERRPSEDRGWDIDAGMVWGPGSKLERASEPLPPEEGDAGQCVHVEDVPQREVQHPVDPQARHVVRSLHPSTGLVRQAVPWSLVQAGAHTTAYHTHERTDEWVYILEGRASLRVGDERLEVSAGDFLGHAAGGPAHVMEPATDLTYLMGGQSDPGDVVIYPEAGLRRVGGRLEPLAGDDR